MSARFNLKFARSVLKKKNKTKQNKNRHYGKLHCNFDSPQTLLLLSLLKEVKPSPDRQMITFLTFDNLSPPLLYILPKTRRRMTTAITFSRQNDACSPASTT